MADVEEPAAKKAKVEDKEKDVADGEEEKVAVKQNDGGESYFEISRTRRVTVRKYKGKVMVDIREVSASVVRKCFGNSCLSRFHVLFDSLRIQFYGESPMKPGKKGITLSPDQYNALRSVVLSGHIDTEIAKLET